ncbi:MAG: hypothetical protein RB191_24800 [Terriglobia bacterium]|nr:hypothetical protein [Terriglobia bacterium]
MRKLVYVALLSCASTALGTTMLGAQTGNGETAARQHAAEVRVRQQLHSPYFEGLYSRTYRSLINRMDPNGYVPESLTGAYHGMFPRTIGALSLLFLETGRVNEAEKSIGCVLRVMKQNNQELVPHVIGKSGNRYTIRDDEFEIDGQATLILGWARLAQRRGRTTFEDQTWNQVSALMSRTTSRAFLDYGGFPSQLGLVRNGAFEHSREGRYWDTYDLLTQSFVGAALKSMAAVAQRRGDTQKANEWEGKLAILSKGVTKNLTAVRDGKLTYLEMRLPNSAAGVPYLGLGWVAFSPVAAGWEPDADPQVMQNTVATMQHSLIKVTHGIPWMPTDSYADGRFSDQIIGKGQAWEMDYSRTHGDYIRIEQILRLIEEANGTSSLYMEGAWLQDPQHNLKISSLLRDSDLPGLEHASWKVVNAGNGEQTVWWCWAMARLRRQMGMPAEPAKPAPLPN